MTNKQQFINELSKLRPSSTFLHLKGYVNSVGEKADYNIVFHMSYLNALHKSIDTLNSLNLVLPEENEARNQLIESFNNSIKKIETTPIEEIDDNFTRFFDESGNYIKGIKLHTESNTLHLYGLVVNKRVLIPGNYKKVNSSKMTIMKNQLRYLTQCGKFRDFRITPNQVESISVERLTLLPPS